MHNLSFKNFLNKTNGHMLEKNLGIEFFLTEGVCFPMSHYPLR